MVSKPNFSFPLQVCIPDTKLDSQNSNANIYLAIIITQIAKQANISVDILTFYLIFYILEGSSAGTCRLIRVFDTCKLNIEP